MKKGQYDGISSSQRRLKTQLKQRVPDHTFRSGSAEKHLTTRRAEPFDIHHTPPINPAASECSRLIEQAASSSARQQRAEDDSSSSESVQGRREYSGVVLDWPAARAAGGKSTWGAGNAHSRFMVRSPSHHPESPLLPPHPSPACSHCFCAAATAAASRRRRAIGGPRPGAVTACGFGPTRRGRMRGKFARSSPLGREACRRDSAGACTRSRKS